MCACLCLPPCEFGGHRTIDGSQFFPSAMEFWCPNWDSQHWWLTTLANHCAPTFHSPLFWERISHLAWNLPVKLGWLASQCQGFTHYAWISRNHRQGFIVVQTGLELTDVCFCFSVLGLKVYAIVNGWHLHLAWLLVPSKWEMPQISFPPTMLLLY